MIASMMLCVATVSQEREIGMAVGAALGVYLALTVACAGGRHQLEFACGNFRSSQQNHLSYELVCVLVALL